MTGGGPATPQPRSKGVWKAVAIGMGVGCGVLVLVVFVAVGFMTYAPGPSQESARRASCLNNTRQIMLAMIMYADEYDGNYPSALVDENEPAQRRLARLLQRGYLNAPRVFKCPSAPYDEPPNPDLLDGPKDPYGPNLTGSSLASIADVYLRDGYCSYGLDVRVKRTGAITRAVLADRPDPRYWGTGVNSPGAGQDGSNSQNHRGKGQNVAYNDCCVSWHLTCQDQINIDPNIYAANHEINPVEDSNIDFGTKP